MFGDDDPRLDEDYVRRVAGEGVGDVLALGAVHDHPASSYRVGEAVRAFDPEVVALELAPLSLPLFEATARTEPRSSEMAAAIAAAPDARVVGVDGLDAQFFRTLLANLREEASPLATGRAVAGGVAALTRHAAACRIAALVGEHTPFDLAVEDRVEHDCDPSDPPEVQATDERRCASTSLSLLRATSAPAPVAVRDRTRESCMVERLSALREAGDVAAVVGLGHLDPIADGLAAAGDDHG